MGVIKVQGHSDQMAVSSPREKSVLALPPFSYPGKLTSGKESGRYFPRFSVALTDLIVSTGTVGTSDSYIVFKMKDQLDATGEIIWLTVGIPAAQQYVKVDLGGDTVLTPNDWISAIIYLGGGHRSLVAYFSGYPSGNGYVQ